jgi:hypothetical protein
MSFLNSFLGSLKKLAIFVLIAAIAIPLRYGSVNPQYLSLRFLHSVLTLKNSLLSDTARPTLSAGYRAFENILRMKPIVEQDPLVDPIIMIKKLRANSVMGIIIPKPSQCQVNKEIFQHDGHSLDTYWVNYHTRKFQRKSDKILLYFHGGGYIASDVHSELFGIFKPIISFFFHMLQWI